MGIFDRLGSVINSYLNDFGDKTSYNFKPSNRFYNDPDLDAAYEELNDYLSGGKASSRESRSEKEWSEYFWQETEAKSGGKKPPPEELREDFEQLNVPFGADNETCKTAYKNLLKIHHPDRHVGHEGNYKKATEKSAKINAAWDRIEKWRRLTEAK